MGFRVEHDLHRRRLGRNLGLGLVLTALVVVLFGLSYAKLGRQQGPSAPIQQEAPTQ